MAASRSQLTTPSVARAVGTDPEQLAEFVNAHPRPTVREIVRAGFTDVSPDELDQETREKVSAWIASQKSSYSKSCRRRTYEHIARHQPIEREQIVEGVTNEMGHFPMEVRHAVGVLCRGGFISCEDVGTFSEPEYVYRVADDPSNP